MSKIPFFADIPYLGGFFRNEEVDNDLSELFMMITPRLILDTQGASLVTSAMLEATRIIKQNYNEPNFVEELFQ